MKKVLGKAGRALGNLLAVLGGFECAVCVMCAVLNLLGLMETEGWGERLVLTAGFALFFLPGWAVFRLGRALRKKCGLPSEQMPQAQPDPEPVDLKPGVGLADETELANVSRGGGRGDIVTVLLKPYPDRLELVARTRDTLASDPSQGTQQRKILPPDWIQTHDAHDLAELCQEIAGLWIAPQVLSQRVPGLRLGGKTVTERKENRFSDVLLYQSPFGAPGFGTQYLYLRRKLSGKMVLCVQSLSPKDRSLYQDERDMTAAFVPGGNIRPILDAAYQMTGAELNPSQVRKKLNEQPLLSDWNCQPRRGTSPVEIPPLEQAVEQGPAGWGESRRWVDRDGVHTIHEPSVSVQYHYFDDGTLVFTGVGATRAVEAGGFDGRLVYHPETGIWSERIIQGTRRAVFTQGITIVGDNLLQDLKNLEELHLADSVRAVHYNRLPKLTVLRAGSDFRSFLGFTGKLKELVLPEGAVALKYHNGGTLPGVTGATEEIQRILDEKLELEFTNAMMAVYRLYPGVGERLAAIARYDRPFAAKTLFYLNWNSKHRSTLLADPEELWKAHRVSKLRPWDSEHIDLVLQWNYGESPYIVAAVLVHGALTSGAKQINCALQGFQLWEEPMMQWWRDTFPDTALIMTKWEETQ